MNHVWRRWIAVMGLVLAGATLARVSLAGGTGPAQDVANAAELQVQSLYLALSDRLGDVVPDALAQIGGRGEATIADHLRVMANAVARIEKESRKTVPKMQKIIDKALVRLEQLNGDLSQFQQVEDLQDVVTLVEESPRTATAILMQAFEDRYNLLP